MKTAFFRLRFVWNKPVECQKKAEPNTQTRYKLNSKRNNTQDRQEDR